MDYDLGKMDYVLFFVLTVVGAGNEAAATPPENREK